MNYKITEVLLNSADKYIVRVIVDENNSTFLKFDHYPTQEEVDSAVQDFINVNTPTNDQN
jgi:hypothetical protein